MRTRSSCATDKSRMRTDIPLAFRAFMIVIHEMVLFGVSSPASFLLTNQMSGLFCNQGTDPNSILRPIQCNRHHESTSMLAWVKGHFTEWILLAIQCNPSHEPTSMLAWIKGYLRETILLAIHCNPSHEPPSMSAWVKAHCVPLCTTGGEPLFWQGPV